MPKFPNLKTDTYNLTSNTNLINFQNSGKDFAVTSGSLNSVSLKIKLQELEDSIQELGKKINRHKKELGIIKVDNDTLRELIKIKEAEIRRNIAEEINRVDEEMKRYFSHQKAENSRLNQQLDQFKNDKSSFQSFLTSLFKRIRDLELQVGIDNKY